MHAPSPDGGAGIPTPPPIALPPPVEPSEAPRRHWRVALQTASSCLLSAAAHATVLLALALTALSAPPPPTGGMLLASATDPAGPKLETIAFEAEPVELKQVAALPSELSDPGAIRLGNVAAAETVGAIGVGELTDNPVGEIGALFGADGRGMAKSGVGRGGATFFGVRAQGRKFVYLVDNSSSMDEGRFETAVAELVRSVRMLDADQLFYVIFYSDMAYPLFYPDAAPRMVPATLENKERLADWLPTVELCGRTRGEEAMAMALALAPDAIYLLGDGAFDDRTIRRTLAIRAPRPTIHALGFDMEERAAAGFKLLAKKFGGTFTHVHVRPEMKRLAHQRDRPRNHAPHGIWGLRLR
jgi:hypothetical protein